jgi:photosystem II stability/assembly factor-like uncharacterized protein
MKKLLLSLAFSGLLALALGGTTGAQPATRASLAPAVAGSSSILTTPWVAQLEQSALTVTPIVPASAPNDIDTQVTITGTDFVALPAVSLGSTALTSVTWVDSTKLTATVPWGMDPGAYTLKVVNPDGGTATLAGAFTVTQGIGQWNGGDLFGGQVMQILMKPGDPNTLYAPAYGVTGLFRSHDGGDSWTHVALAVHINNGKFAIDPLHPDWLYAYGYNGLGLSKDQGDTWTTVMPNHWPDGRQIRFPQVHVSPLTPQVLFVSSSEAYGDPNASGAEGLLRSADGGLNWISVPDMENKPVQDVAFDPAVPSKMVLATSDAHVYRSVDGGENWTEVTPKPNLSSLGLGGVIRYNPDRPTEVWLASAAASPKIFKSTDTDATPATWQIVTPTDGSGSSFVTFTSADSVFISRHHSTNGGLNWNTFGQITSSGEIRLDPDHPGTGYIGDDTFGVQKTIDGGTTWQVKNQGLAGMRCNALGVSRADPLRVFATFGDGMGIYRSNDGTTNWTYLPIPGSLHVGQVREDPINPQRLYATAGSSIYVSEDEGEHWLDRGWSPGTTGMLSAMAVDPNPGRAGHLLIGLDNGSYGIGTGVLYQSSDYGVSWHAVTMPQSLAQVYDITFDPGTPGLVYLATLGTGVYRSTDYGANWVRIDDLQKPDLLYANRIAIATHPQHVLIVATDNGPYRSVDGGATWQKTKSFPSGGSTFMFADGDSSRLYFGTGIGLFFSSDAGDSWTRAAGAFGQLQIMALGYANADGHTILYAATSGGSSGTTGSTAAATSSKVARKPLIASAAASGLVDAGIYRYVVLPPTFSSFSPSSGPVGTSVTLAGTRFSGATKVAFHGTAATSFSVASDTKITATVPSGASTGTIAVTAVGGTGTSASNFTVTTKVSAPSISSFGLTRTRFAVASKAKTAGKSKVKRGSSLRYKLSKAATATILVARPVPGVRKGASCVVLGKKHLKAHAKRCTAYLSVGKLSHKSKKGANMVAFSGRLGGKALKPGSYRATITARVGSGSVSKPRTAKFTILRG